MNGSDFDPLPYYSNIKLYEQQADNLAAVYHSADSAFIAHLRQHHPLFLPLPEIGSGNTGMSKDEARQIIARGYGFHNWSKLAEFTVTVTQENSPVATFESAVDAIVSGDTAQLESLLRNQPWLIHERSKRKHQSTLLHYVGANGFEGYRQRTPSNIIHVAKMLLDAGADVNALAFIYGKDTTLDMVATSVFPALAGVQIELLELLLEAGAVIDAEGSTVNACLANGRPQAALFLAERGAKLDLEGAAGVGRLDLVASFFTGDGGLKDSATREQLESGFMWSCEYGHTDVVEFLLNQGVDVGTQVRGMTGLHWAVIGGRLDTIKLLIRRNAPLEAKNSFGGTIIGQTLWASANSGPVGLWPNTDTDWKAIAKELIAAGANLDASPGLRERVEQLLR
jgi:ankyrin repeat protein